MVLEAIKVILGYISKKYYKKLIALQILIVVSSILELSGFVSIIPFLAIVSDPSIVTSNAVLIQLYEFSGLDNVNDFIFLFGLMVLGLLILGSVISIVKIWYTTYFANIIGFGIGDTLYRYYLSREYEFHLINSSSYLTKQITIEAIRVKNILKNIMRMNADIVTTCIIAAVMIAYDPIASIVATTIIALIYLLINRKVSNILIKNGTVITNSSKERLRVLINGFGGINDISMLSKESYFHEKIKKTGDDLAKGTTINQVIAQIPIKFFQLVLFGGMIMALLYLLKLYDNDIGKVITTFSAYAIAAYKLVPAFQSIFSGITGIKSNLPAVRSIDSDIQAQHSLERYEVNDIVSVNDSKTFQSFELKNVSYKYDKKTSFVINNINLKVFSGDKVGIVGGSGAGKTTLINIVSTLLGPTKGDMLVNKNLLTSQNKKNWRSSIGMVNQDVFLLNANIIENIAFGVAKETTNIEKVNECINAVKLNQYVAGLDKGIYTEVGERGVKLSGGQKQRIGLARALYHNASILILDEATSALDGVTEKEVINELMDDDRYTVIMIAHRIQTLKKCKTIYIMHNGEIVDHGGYAELKEKNKYFREMGYIE
jgi:ATP-binding cassette, subfamily B, bacterial PglK